MGKISPFYIVIAVAAVIAVSGVGYQISRNSSNRVTTYSPPKNWSPSASPSPTNTPIPTLTPKATVYTSKRLGVSFSYFADFRGQRFYVKEIGDRIYLYGDYNERPEEGKFVEVFSKDPKDTIEQALTKRYLSSPTGKNCKVTEAPLGLNYFPPNSTLTTATIWKSFSTGGDTPFGADNDPFGSGRERAKCLQTDKVYGGVLYFLADAKHPNKLLMFVIGQDNILSSGGTWDQTIQFID